MAITRNQFVIKHYDAFGGNFVDANYLGAAYEAGKPYVFQDTLMKVFSSKSRFFTGKILMGMTGAKSDGVKEIPIEIYRWYLQGAERKCARSMGNLDPTNTMPGINGTDFRIWLDLDYYTAPDVLFSEDNDFPLEIVSGPTQYGGGFIYTVRIQGDNPQVFLPTYLLEAGSEFDKVWTTLQSEYNEEYGTQQVPNSFMLESQVSAFGQKITITDKAWRTQGRLGVNFQYTDPRTGKAVKVEKFLPMYEAIMHDELYMSMEAQGMYGKRQTKPGPKGYWKKTGPGIREQLKGSWIEYYNGPLTVNRLKDYLMDIFFSRTDEADRKVVAMTGTLGSMMFHDMLASEASSFLTLDTHFTQKLSENPRHLSFGAQFTHYQGPEGIEVTLIKNPMYDDRRYCKRFHPQYPDKPIDSARFTFLDFGDYRHKNGVDKNITMLRVKDTYSWGYVAGTYTPTGPVKGGMAGGLIDGYDMYSKGTYGCVIFDPTRCGELVFDFEY